MTAVAETGPEKLSASLPKRADAIERIMAKGRLAELWRAELWRAASWPCLGLRQR